MRVDDTVSCPNGSVLISLQLLSFSYLVSASDRLKWWKVDGALQQTFHVRGSFLKNVQYSPDFQTFVTVDSAGILYILKRVEL